MASVMKFEIPLFDRNDNFTIWQCTIIDLLVQQDLDVVLEEEKPAEMKDSEWKSIKGKLQILLGWLLLFESSI